MKTRTDQINTEQGINYRPLWLTIAAAAAVSLLLTCVINPLYIVFTSDIVYLSGILPTLFGILSDLADNLSAALLISTVCVSVYLHVSAEDSSGKKAVLINCTAFAVVLLKNGINLAATLVTQGFSTFETADLLFTAGNSLTECCILAVGLTVSRVISQRHVSRERELARAYERAGRGYPGERADVYPFRSFFSVKNPVLSGIFWASVTLLIPLVISRLVYDINLGAPADIDEAAAIPIGYLSDLFWSFLVYTAGFFTASKIMSLQKDAAAEEPVSDC